MWWRCILLLFIPLYHVGCDLYGHTPRCSNNRLDGTGRARTTNNRIFDSQNNDRAGYNVGGANDRKLILTNIYHKAKTINKTGVRAEWEEKQGPPGKMKYYEGSVLHVTWTNQHECGGENAICEIVLQYMCDDNLRDGIEDKIIPDNVENCHIGEDQETRSCDEDRRFGLHENLQYYATCKNTKRNTRLYAADQELSNRHTAKFTRQNRNGNRNGYECPEERDYYPYWRPSPWIDIAVMTGNMERCELYRNESENVKPRYYCKVPEKLIQKLIKERREDYRIPITEERCVGFEYEGTKGEWVQDMRKKHPRPECIDTVKKSKSRDNHHGNGADGFFLSYNWTIPNTPHKHCALRMRYNISTAETPWEKDQAPAETPQLKAAIAANYRCKGEKGCCTDKTPCGLGEGDCDNDAQCGEGLICGNDNSPWDSVTDVCIIDKHQQKRPLGVKLVSAVASSIYSNNNESYGPRLAFSGTWQKFYHSNRETNPWVRMEIEPTVLSSITILNRKSCCGNRLRNVKVHAGMSLENPIVGTFDGPGQTRGEYVIPFSKPILVKYITIQQIGRREYLQLNGIKVNESSVDACPDANLDYSGHDIKSVKVDSWQDCRKRCGDRADCHAWTYITRYFYRGSQRKVCWLKKSTFRNGRARLLGVISGVKGCAESGEPVSVYEPPLPRCRGEDNGCCTAEKPCDFGEGDCDSHDQCKGALVCGFNNCFHRFGPNDDCCTDNLVANLVGGDPNELKKRGFTFKNDPTVQPLSVLDGDENLGKLFNLDLAINTAQFGRTFEDRSHEFSILDRPEELKTKKIYNMEVRGKRGNIVQVYPSTEYDYSPNRLNVQQGDHLHIQWTGSERNPGNNAGNGRNGYDRNNMILLAEQTYVEGTGKAVPFNLKNGHWGRSYPSNFVNDDDKTLLGLSREDRQGLALSDDVPLLPSSELLSSKDPIQAVSAPVNNNIFKLQLDCQDGEEIRIISAQYGGCPPGTDVASCSSALKQCTGFKSVETLKNACDGLKECLVVANKDRFGVNCQTLGHLKVTYKCIKAEEPEYTCGDFVLGDGLGTSEVKVGNQKGRACVKACWKLKFVDGHRDINAVTVRANALQRGCYCERKMTSRKVGGTTWKSCYLEKKDAVEPKKWRDDLRCGEDFALPGGGPSECDPSSATPCCSDKGYCGSTSEYCHCEGCINYLKGTKGLVKELPPGPYNGGYIVYARSDCWSGCGSKGGSCPQFCGTDGYCCRRGRTDCPQEMAAVAPNHHTCVTKAASSFAYSNYKDKECTAKIWEKKGCVKLRPGKTRGYILLNWRINIKWDGALIAEFAKNFVCACAEAAQKAGVTHFGTHFWGECWTLETDRVEEDPDGECKLMDGTYKTKCDSTTKSDYECLSSENNYFLYAVEAREIQRVASVNPSPYNVDSYRCNGQNNFCCTVEKPCDLYEGDCDTDQQCKGRLLCGNNNCAWDDDGDDCCYEPSYLDLDAAPHYFNLKPKELSKEGEFKYMCSRNNDFTNRSQKGKIKVSKAEKKDESKESPVTEKDQAVSAIQDSMERIEDEINDLEEGLMLGY